MLFACTSLNQTRHTSNSSASTSDDMMIERERWQGSRYDVRGPEQASRTARPAVPRRAPLERNTQGGRYLPTTFNVQRPTTNTSDVVHYFQAMLADLIRPSQPALRQIIKSALSTRTIATPRYLSTSPTPCYMVRKSGYFGDMAPGVPASLHAFKRPVKKVQEDQGWEQIFSPLMRKFLRNNHPGQSDSSVSQRTEEIWAERETKVVATLPLPPGPYTGMGPIADCRTKSYFVCSTGRSVSVPSNDGFLAAYGKLNRILSENRVRAELMRARRHEKTGVKRRRLRSERWRRKFAHEVCSFRLTFRAC